MGTRALPAPLDCLCRVEEDEGAEGFPALPAGMAEVIDGGATTLPEDIRYQM